MNYYKTSSGDRIAKSVIDSRVRKAKIKLLSNQICEHGYNFCQKCGISSGVRLDCSHILSVDYCQKNGMSEKAYDVGNMEVLCRECHVVMGDNKNFKFSLYDTHKRVMDQNEVEYDEKFMNEKINIWR